MKIALTIFLTIISLSTMPSTGAGQDKGSETIMLQGGKLGNVPFSHRLHQKALGDCTVCHNLFPQVAGSIEKLQSEGKLKKKEIMDQCMACHKKTSERVKTELAKCSACHKR